MPELPEVETVRRGLERLVKGRTIVAIEIRYPKMVLTGADKLVLDLVAQAIEAVGRRGKYLIFDFGQLVMVSHLRMEGKYLLFPDDVPENKHFHAFFRLDNGATLVYQDVRKFGTMEVMAKADLEAFFKAKKIGPEPTETDFKLPAFKKALLLSKKPIKPHLLEQRLVAGLGNIYVDEVLWRAKVHPATPSNQLKPKQVKAIHDQTIAVLQLGIERGGSTIRTYQNALGEAGTMQDFLMVYGQAGRPCGHCGREIVKMQLGGRGTHFCPRCQRL